MAGDIYLLRHGQTEWNAEGRFQGRLDSPLTPIGRDQAREMGRRLAALCPPSDRLALQVSPLGRARQTAEIIGQIAGYGDFATDDRLCEMTLGSWDGLTDFDIDQLWPGLLDAGDRFERYFRSPDGEPYEELLVRVRSWLDEVARAEGPVVAVSHGVTSRVIRGAYLGLERASALRLPVPQGVIWRLHGGGIESITT